MREIPEEKPPEGTKCQYEYQSQKFKGDQCPHKAEFYNEKEGKKIPVCYWHHNKDGKDVKKEIGKRIDEDNLRESYFRKANLEEVEVSLESDLRGSTFKKANLKNAELIHLPPYYNDNLKGVRFDNANLQGASLTSANFEEASLIGADLRNADLTQVNFNNCFLLNAKFDENIIEGNWDIFEKLADEEGTYKTPSGTPIHFLPEVKSLYRRLKNIFKKKGFSKEAGFFHYKERKLDRINYWLEFRKPIKSLEGEYDKLTLKRIYLDLTIYFLGILTRILPLFKWFGNSLYCVLSGYLEKPWRVVASSITFIFIFAGIYKIGNLITPYSSTANLNYQPSIWESLYFSLSTFTTVGFGDFRPTPSGRLLAGIEAFIGAFMIALFVLTMGRKMMR